MAHVTEPAIRAWRVGWHDAADDARRNRLPPGNIGERPSAYILGYMAYREHLAKQGVRLVDVYYDEALAHFMENYDL